jgi:hypothetical protein
MRIVLLFLTGLASAYPLTAGAADKPDPAAGPVVPDGLRPWVSWVLAVDVGRPVRCPGRVGKKDEVTCVWPSRLDLKLDARGGSFSQEWQVYDPSLVVLPGDKEHWPADVKSDGKPARVVDDGDSPKVLLGIGRHVLAGRFSWDALPESLGILPATGLVALTIVGKRVDFPLRDAEGRLFLGQQKAANAGSFGWEGRAWDRRSTCGARSSCWCWPAGAWRAPA